MLDLPKPVSSRSCGKRQIAWGEVVFGAIWGDIFALVVVDDAPIVSEAVQQIKRKICFLVLFTAKNYLSNH